MPAAGSLVQSKATESKHGKRKARRGSLKKAAHSLRAMTGRLGGPDGTMRKSYLVVSTLLSSASFVSN
jgi:hypothetical protein